MPQPARARAVDASELTRRTWRVLEDELRDLGTPFLERVVPIAEFRKIAEGRPTTVQERTAIIEQAELLIDHLYPHLPFKREVFSFVPKTSLFDCARSALNETSEVAFQAKMLEGFALVRDAHTTYGLPEPFNGALAFLPFQVSSVVDAFGQRHFVVTSVMSSKKAVQTASGKWSGGGFGHKLFQPGALIVRWSGHPMEEHVNRVAATVPGGNESAWFRRGLVACTSRILTYSPFPFEDEMPEAEIVYRPPTPGVGGGPEQVIRLPWGVARFPARPEIPRKSFSMSFVNLELNTGVQRLHYRDVLREEQKFQDSNDERAVSRIPEVFEFQFTGGPRKKHPIDLAVLIDDAHPGLKLGYFRIKSFNDGGEASGVTERLVGEARRILTLLDEEAPDGLVLDIRGNPGGDIEAAEQMLQMLTPGRIEPELFHLARTDTMLGVLRSIKSPPRRLTEADAAKLAAAKLELDKWLDDADETAPGSDPRLTSGQPLTDPDQANRIGQVYHGPVVLLADGSTYSAADIFAAGFQDHGIGLILSDDLATGGGGANVCNHSALLSILGPKPGIPIAPLPRDVFMRVAFRRCRRVGANAGKDIEDFGVRFDDTYSTNIIDDVLAGMPGMITRAAELIGRRLRQFRIDAPSLQVNDDGSVTVDVRVVNLVELRFFLDGKSAEGVIDKPGGAVTVIVKPPEGVSSPSRLRIEGWAEAKLACVRNIDLRPAPGREVKTAEDTRRQRLRNRASQNRARARRARRR
jgi:hypothetical protein